LTISEKPENMILVMGTNGARRASSWIETGEDGGEGRSQSAITFLFSNLRVRTHDAQNPPEMKQCRTVILSILAMDVAVTDTLDLMMTNSMKLHLKRGKW